jgi:hypothetical protein
VHVQVIVVLEMLDEELPPHSILVDAPLCPPSQAALACPAQRPGRLVVGRCCQCGGRAAEGSQAGWVRHSYIIVRTVWMGIVAPCSPGQTAGVARGDVRRKWGRDPEDVR